MTIFNKETFQENNEEDLLRPEQLSTTICIHLSFSKLNKMTQESYWLLCISAPVLVNLPIAGHYHRPGWGGHHSRKGVPSDLALRTLCSELRLCSLLYGGGQAGKRIYCRRDKACFFSIKNSTCPPVLFIEKCQPETFQCKC